VRRQLLNSRGEPHFGFPGLFTALIRTRGEMDEKRRLCGLPPATGNDLITHLRIANGDIMDPEEEVKILR
jgi:hypothetical protein